MMDKYVKYAHNRQRTENIEGFMRNNQTKLELETVQSRQPVSENGPHGVLDWTSCPKWNTVFQRPLKGNSAI